MRTAASLFTSLLLLLVWGHNHAHASKKQSLQSAHTIHALVNNVHITGIEATDNPGIYALPALPGMEQELLTDEIEEDDDDVVSSKKHQEIADGPAPTYFTTGPPAVTIFVHHLPDAYHLSYTTADKYLLHRSIRI